MTDSTHGTGRAYADNLTIHERIIIDLVVAEASRPGGDGVGFLFDAGVRQRIVDASKHVLDMMGRDP